MLEFLTPKNKQVFKAKWVDSDNEKNNGYFKFSKVGAENNHKTSNGNMSVKTGQVIWETKTTLDIKTDDFCYYNNHKYFVVEVAIDDSEGNIAHLFIQNNGNVKKIITLQKVG